MILKSTKITAILTAILLFVSVSVFADTNDVLLIAPAPDMAAPANFSDLSADDWAYDSIISLTKRGIVSGDALGTIRPDENITREEVAKMTVAARDFEIASDAQINFSDAHTVSDWAKGYVLTAIEKGIITGFADGTIRGNAYLTRAEMAAFVVRSLNANTDNFSAVSFTDVTDDMWYAKYVECAKALGIITGYADGTFGGDNAVTRREAFVMIERMANLLDILNA